MQISLIYNDQAVIEEVPLDLWREVFYALGWLPSLADKRDGLTHADIVAAIEKDDLSDDFLSALESLHTLGTEDGREAIIAIMQERRVELQSLPKGVSERELAIRLYLGQRNNASLADVFARAHIQVQESGEQRRYHEFLAIARRPVTNVQSKGEHLRAAVLRHCQESDLGDHVHVSVVEDDDFYTFRILRTDRMKKPLAVLPGQAARTLIPHRQVHSDLLRYDAGLGRLRIAARSASIVDCYRKILGEVLFEDQGFFNGDAVCSLVVLQDRGRTALEHHGIFGVTRVRLTECTWECGDRSIMVLRDPNCFDLIDRHKLAVDGGTLVQAKLKVDTIGRSTRPVTVNIRVPSRIEVSKKSQEPLIDELLDAIGIRTVPQPSPPADLWTLHPWRKPLPVWRNLFGNMTDKMVQYGILHRTQLDAVPHPEYPTAGNLLRVHPVAASEFQGVSDVAEIPSRSLSATDVEGLELFPEQLRQYLRNTLGITTGGSAWSSDSDILELGCLQVGDEYLYVAYALRQPSDDIGNLLRQRAAAVRPILLVPAGQTPQRSIATVVLDSPLPDRHYVIRQGVYACGIENNVPAIHRAPSNAELVVDRHLKKVWVNGIELQQLKPDTQEYRFIEMLASANGTLVPNGLITKVLSIGRLVTDGTVVARQAKAKAKRYVEKALAESGVADRGDPFPASGKGCYRCILLPFVD
jgi:hypothetical protein